MDASRRVCPVRRRCPSGPLPIDQATQGSPGRYLRVFSSFCLAQRCGSGAVLGRRPQPSCWPPTHVSVAAWSGRYALIKLSSDGPDEMPYETLGPVLRRHPAQGIRVLDKRSKQEQGLGPGHATPEIQHGYAFARVFGKPVQVPGKRSLSQGIAGYASFASSPARRARSFTASCRAFQVRSASSRFSRSDS